MKRSVTNAPAFLNSGVRASGYTLVETMLALAVGAIVIVGMYEGYNTLHKWLIAEGTRSDMRQNARAGMETLTRDIEMAGYQATGYGDVNKTGLAITLASAHEIEIDQQRPDGATIGSSTPTYEPKMVYYHLATDMKTGRQNLYRQIRSRPGQRSADEIVAENISDFTLAYFDKNNHPVDCLYFTANHSRYTYNTPRPRAVDYCQASVPSGMSPDPLKNIRRIAVSLTTVPAGATTLSAAAAAGDATITVASTAGFPSSGKLDVFTTSGANVAAPVSYTGKDATHFTGCGGVPVVAAGAVVAQATPIGRAAKPLTLTASVVAQNLDAADEATPDCIPPLVPTGLAVVDSRSCGNKLNVKWNANADLDLAGYKIFYGPTDYIKVPVSALAVKSAPEYTLNPGCLLITKNADRTASPNTYAIQVVAYDSSGNDSEKSAAVSANPSTDVTAFGGGNDTTVNPLKPAPPATLTVNYRPGTSFALYSPPPSGSWPSTKLFALPGGAQGSSLLNRSDWPGDTWPDCPNDEEPWPACATWPECATWPDSTCWPGYQAACGYLESPNKPNAVRASAASGGLIISWPPADTATAGYRLYRSSTPFANGAHVDGSLQIAGSKLIDGESRLLDPDGQNLLWVDWIDAKLEGCATYYYAVASVNCDETLVAGYHYNSTSAALSDYTVASATTPAETTAPPAPGLAAGPAGEQRALIALTNPLADAAADFDRTEIWWSRSPASPPHLDGTAVIDGTLVPDGAGIFRNRGSQVILFDSQTDAEPVSPSLVAGATYNLLAVSYDHCGNVSGSDPVTVMLPGPSACVDTPAGPPTAPTAGTLKACEPDSVVLSWENSADADAAGVQITRTKTGGGTKVLTDEQPPLAFGTARHWTASSESWTDAGPLEEGAEYTYEIAATDCVWEQALLDDVAAPYPGPLNTLPLGPVHPGGLRRYVTTGGTEHYTTTVSDGMASGAPWTYTYHNNVKFWLQNTSRSPVTVKQMAITWDNPNVVLKSVAIGGAPSGTTAQTRDVPLAEIAQVSTPTKQGADAIVGKVWHGTFDVAVADHADGTGAASGGIPVVLRFTNCDGTTVDADTDMRNRTLAVYLWVDHSFDDVECPTLTNLPIDVPRGPELGCFMQSAPGSAGIDSYQVIGAGNTALDNDIEVSTGNGVNVYGRKILDHSREVHSSGLNQGFDVLKVYGATAAVATGVPAMPTPSTFERQLQLVGGNRYALSLSPPVVGELLPSEGNKVHWYYALAVDKTGNWDRAPDPTAGNYAYLQTAFDLCTVTPQKPEQPSAKVASGSATVTWCAPTAYTSGAAIKVDDVLAYDVFYSNNGGTTWQSAPNGANLSSRGYIHVGPSAGTYIYRVRAKNSCTACTTCVWGLCCSAYSTESSGVVIP